MDSYTQNVTNQLVDPRAKVAKEHQLGEKRPLTVNPGDRIVSQSQTIEEKSKQIAVDAPDITGDQIKVPTYFIVEYPNGEKKALHHVRDAKEISEVIRQAQFDQVEWKLQSLEVKPKNLNVSGLAFIIALVLLTVPILIGIF